MDERFEIDNAICVDEGLAKLGVGHYDVVISDYEMPQKNGLEFLLILRKQKNKIPFILFTGKGREEVAIRALNLGADGYHNKQGDPETVYGELSHKICLLVERDNAKTELRKQNSRFAKLADQTPGMLYQFLRRPNGSYCVPFTSDSIQSIFGCSPQDVRDDFSPILKVIVPEDQEKVIKSIEYSADNLSYWQCEYRVKLPGQRIRWMWGQSMPEKLEDGNILWSGYNADITERKIAEEKLRGTFNVLERASESIDAGLAVISKDYDVIWANKLLMDLGVSPEKKCYSTFNRRDDVCPDCGVKKIFEEDSPLDVHEFKSVNAEGEVTWIELRVTPLKDENGNVTAALELAVPINERKKVEAALHLSEEKFRNLSDQSPNMIFINKRGRVVYANRKCEETTGYTQDEFLSPKFDFFSLCSSENIETMKSSFAMHLKGENVAPYEFTVVAKDGKKIEAIITTKLIDYENEQALLGIITDITKLKAAEKTAKEELALRSTLLDNVPCIALFLEKNSRKIIASNKNARDIGAIPGKTCYETCANANIPCNFCLAPKLWATGEKQVLEEVEHNGKYYKGIWLPYNETSYVHYIFDITDAKKAEYELKQNEARFRELTNFLPEMVFEIDLKGNVIFANSRAFEIIGYSSQDFSNDFNVMRLVAPEDFNRAKKNMANATFKEIRHSEEYLCVKKDGTRFPVEISSAPIVKDGQIVGARGILVDITKRKEDLEKMQNALVETTAREQEVSAFLGTVKEILKNDDFAVVAKKIFDDCKVLIGATAGYVALLSDDGSENKVLFLDAGGLKCTVDPSLPMPIRGLREIAYQSCKVVYENDFSKSNWIGFMPNGHAALRNVMFVPLIVEGKAVGLMGLANKASDFTERDALVAQGFGEYASLALGNSWKLREIQNQQRSLTNLNEKLQVVGSLARHDVRNKLSTINSYAYLLRKKHADQPDLVEGLSRIEMAVKESARMFDFVKMYEQLGIEELTYVDVEAKINKAVSLLSGSLPKITNECGGLRVLADSFLRQLFYNLIENTKKYGQKTSNIRIYYEVEGDSLRLVYEDDGVGIPFENKTSLFRKGFTTGQGTGFGLFLIKKMVTIYGWSLVEEGVPGQGAKFVITIDRIDENGQEKFRIER